MVKTFSEHRAVKPQRSKLYCKLIPEPICGLSCANASLPHANLSLISLNCSRQVCTLHTTTKPRTFTHTETFQQTLKSPQKRTCSLYFTSQPLELWWATGIPLRTFCLLVNFGTGFWFQMMNITVRLKFKIHISSFPHWHYFTWTYI